MTYRIIPAAAVFLIALLARFHPRFRRHRKKSVLLRHGSDALAVLSLGYLADELLAGTSVAWTPMTVGIIPAVAVLLIALLARFHPGYLRYRMGSLLRQHGSDAQKSAYRNQLTANLTVMAPVCLLSGLAGTLEVQFLLLVAAAVLSVMADRACRKRIEAAVLYPIRDETADDGGSRRHGTDLQDADPR